jgi:two-component system, response regulator PdtaR
MKILMVEDDVLVAMVIHEALIEAGHEVLGPVRTAGEALKLARAVKPDLALVNIDLADDSKGTDLARTLRTEFGVPALFVSGSIHEARAARDAALGYIAKPFLPKLLRESVEVVQALVGGARLDEQRIPAGLTLFEAANP